MNSTTSTTGTVTQRWLICGTRYYLQQSHLTRVMDLQLAAHRMTGASDPIIVHGAARGADTLGGLWAKSRGLTVESYPADWEGLGTKAGPIRNQQMLDTGIDHGFAFYDRPIWASAGTSDMVRRLRAAGIAGCCFFGEQTDPAKYPKKLVAARAAFLAKSSVVAG